MKILLYFTFLIYPYFSGWKDAVLWSKKAYDAYEWDEHIIFICERLGVAAMVILSFYVGYHKILDQRDFWTVLGCVALSFFFVHNGKYYQARHYIDGAYLNFASDTKNSSSPLNVIFPVRLTLFIIVIIYLFCYEYYF